MWEGDKRHAAMRISIVKIMLRLRHRNNAVPEMFRFGKIYQKGFTTTIKTMMIINRAGASFMIRQ